MNKYFFCALTAIGFLLFKPHLSAQMRATLPTPADIAATITADELKRHLLILASDEMEGRETGTEGQRKAAEYLAEVFASMGLPALGDDNSHLQRIFFKAEGWQQIELTINEKKYRHLWEYYAVPALNEGVAGKQQFDEVIFLGYGIDDEKYSDYKNANVKGKAILIYDGEPVDAQGHSYLTGSSSLSGWSMERKLQAAKARGVAMVFVIDSKFKENVAEMRRTLNSNRLRPAKAGNPETDYAPNCHLSSETAKALLGERIHKVVKQRDKILKTGRPGTAVVPAKIEIILQKEHRTLNGHNVLGFVEGIDPALKNEVLVVSAHFDHLGKRGDAVYYGADDNASGTSTVLEIAQAFAEAKRQGAGPRRSVLFLLVSGEEKGLLGSQYYAEHPLFPLENTIANVNVDMVGRVDEKHRDNPNYIYVIGADRLSTELHRINENANRTYTQLELDYTYNAKNDPNRYYYRSDHYNFAERGIPAIFYFSGTHEDYHRVTDTADKINFDKMVVVGRLVFHTAWELANRDKRIEVDVKSNGKVGER